MFEMKRLPHPRTLINALMACVLLAISSVSFGAKPSDDLIVQCSSCHLGANISVSTPQLGGLKKSYIREQIENFRIGMRGSGSESARLMAEAVSQLTDREVDAISHWFSKQKPVPNISVGATLITSDDQTYKALCQGCHDSFMGKLMTGSPSIKHLSAGYALAQIELFATGVRTSIKPNKHKEKMAKVAGELSSEQKKSLYRYLQRRK